MSRWFVGVALLACGCGPPYVEGSLGELLDLHYARTVIYFNPEIDFTLPVGERLQSLNEVAVQYVVTQGDGENIIFQITANYGDTDGIPDPYPTTYTLDLAESYASSSGQRGEVSRNVLDEPGVVFPALARGSFVISEPVDETRPISGRFAVTFENGIEFACGRTAFDQFEAVFP